MFSSYIGGLAYASLAYMQILAYTGLYLVVILYASLYAVVLQDGWPRWLVLQDDWPRLACVQYYCRTASLGWLVFSSIVGRLA